MTEKQHPASGAKSRTRTTRAMRHKDRANLARTTVILAKVLNGVASPKEGFFRGALVKRP